ncbi:MFS transporter [Microlunatus soli]|uniref:Predicted arabinose efflux permease, MFS family n=1 Tax=Microlunatus soli TaxID=630515 RepID=A0A1H1P4F7_9ACTN|nr:MFS transporter [Microlunatus soli]SDS06053.1 Predicted arabinose efflux permease, MFS family [Microlunatus soli]
MTAAAFGRTNAARWVVAYTCAVAGDATFYVVLTWAAAESGGPQWSGLILAAGAVPRVILMLPGGVLADRVDPRRLAIGSDLGRCLAMLVAATLGILLGLLPWWLLGVAAIFGVIDAIFMPAVGAMPAGLVGPGDLKRLQAWRISGVRVSNIIGPTAGAVLISFGAAHAFAAIAVLFAVSVGLLVSVRLRPRADAAPAATQDSRRISRAGIRMTLARLRRHGLGRLVLVTALTDIPFSGPVLVGVILLVQERHWPATAAGGVLSAFSIGALITGLLCAVAPSRLLSKPTVLAAIAVTAGLLVALTAATATWSAIIIGALLGVSTAVTMISCHGEIQQATPPDLLGRVTALLALLTLGVSPIVFAASGAVVAAAGAAPFFYAAAAVIIVAGVGAATIRFTRTPPPAATTTAASSDTKFGS